MISWFGDFWFHGYDIICWRVWFHSHKIIIWFHGIITSYMTRISWVWISVLISWFFINEIISWFDVIMSWFDFNALHPVWCHIFDVMIWCHRLCIGCHGSHAMKSNHDARWPASAMTRAGASWRALARSIGMIGCHAMKLNHDARWPDSAADFGGYQFITTKGVLPEFAPPLLHPSPLPRPRRRSRRHRPGWQPRGGPLWEWGALQRTSCTTPWACLEGTSCNLCSPWCCQARFQARFRKSLDVIVTVDERKGDR